MGRVVWLVGVLAGVLVTTPAQDISRSSPLYFPDGEMPSVHPYSSSETLQKSTIDSEWRLPRDVLPIKYNLTIFVDPNKETFSGNVQIFFYCVKETRKVTLHALDLDIPGDFPKIYDVYNETQIFDGLISRDDEHQAVTFTVDHMLQEGHMYQMNVSFKRRYPDELRGLYRSNYTQNGETKWLSVTHFEPTGARRMFPCFDEPNMKASFIVTIIHPREFTALTNSPLQSKREVKGSATNQTISSFKETVKMSTYLLALVVSEYQNYSMGNNRANIWARPDIISGAKFSQKLAADALNRLENYTNIKFPMGKIDHVAVPHFGAGAMENYGLITYREPNLSFQENITKTPVKVNTVTVIAHELAHQWFGNLVTLNWWSSTWLNEAFATFVSYHLPGEDKSWRLREQFVPAVLQQGMEVDQNPATSIPMSSPVESPKEISTKFDPITYSKGGSVLRMFENLLGETMFQEALRNYLNKRATVNAVPEDLFQELEKVSNRSRNRLPEKVDWISFGENWTSQAGLPLVTVTRNYVNKDVVISQERFCSGDGAAGDKCKPGLWWIPVNWTFEGRKDQEGLPILWLPAAKESVTFSNSTLVPPDKWILANYKATGYYRVNYDEQNWKLLFDALYKNPSDIPTENRAQILHDVLHIALAREDFVPQALNITLFLQNEEDIVVWMSGVKVLRELYEIVGPTEAYDAFSEYARKMLTKIYAKKGINRQQKVEGIEDALIRAYITPYACMFGIQDCLKDARLLIDKILDGSSVDPDIETAVTCGGVLAGEEELFWRVRQKAIQSKDAPINDVLLAALSCSKEESLVKEHLHRVLSEESFPKNKISPAIVYVIKSVKTFNIGYDFIHDNFKKISDLIGDDAMSSLLKVLCNEVRTGNQYQNVQTMLESKKYNIKDIESLKKLLKSRSNIVDRNKKLVRRIATWLGEETGKPVSPDEPDDGRSDDGSSVAKPTICIILLSIFLSLYR